MQELPKWEEVTDGSETKAHTARKQHNKLSEKKSRVSLSTWEC